MMTALEKYGFRDALGHPLKNCVDYLDIVTALRLAVETISVLEHCCPANLLPDNYRMDALDIVSAVLQVPATDSVETSL